MGDEVRRASGGAGGRRLLEAADAWVGDKVRRASSGADSRRLLELCSRDSDNFATFSMAKKFLDGCIGAHALLQVHLLCGGHAVYRLMVCPLPRGGAWMDVPLARSYVDVGGDA